MLFMLFIVLPLTELAVIIKVSMEWGVLNTLGLLILLSALGAWIIKHQGMGLWRRLNESVRVNRIPGVELVDGALILADRKSVV